MIEQKGKYSATSFAKV